MAMRARTVDIRWQACTAAAIVVAFAAVTCGCGGGDHPATSTSTERTTPAPVATQPRAMAPDPLDHCDSAGSGWRPLEANGTTGAPAASLGSGRLGVVFANDSINDACSWSAEARALAAHGHAVAVFKAARGLEPYQAVTVGAALRGAGARRVVLIGASVGARAVLQAGLEHPRGVVGLVALSAERSVSTSPADLLPDVRHVRLPVLSIGSRGDPLTQYGRDTRAFHRRLAHDRMLLLSGSDHGVELLGGRHAPQVRGAILRFLRSLQGA
jgi:pimeloyl-ACP methyl ester carboxylesterase